MAQTHCIPIEESRRLHHDAYRAHVQDSLISELQGKVIVLEQSEASTRENLTAELRTEKEKNRLQSENENDFKVQILNSQAETRYFKKKERKARRERNAVIGIGVVLLVIAVIK